MSHYMTALAMKQRGLKPAAKIVLYWLADHHNGETGDCFPSHKRLAELCECSDRDVRRQINKLVELGLVSIESRTRGNGSQTSNAYILHLSGNDAWTNGPPPMDKLSAPPVHICPTHNLGNNNLGKELNISAKADDGFDDFWSIVPRKVGKGQAKKAWRSALKKADAKTIISAMQEYAQQREGQDHQFTAHPSTWLNGERWLDEAQPSQQDFYNQIQKHLQGESNAISGPDQNSSVNRNRLSAPVSAPEPSGQRCGSARDFSDSRGGQRSGFDFIKPRRI